MNSKKLAMSCLISLFLVPFGLGQNPGGGPGDHQGFPGSLMGHGGLELEHNLVLPQIAVGRDISTTLTLASLGNAAMQSWLESEDLLSTGTVYFFRQDGTPLEVHVNDSAPKAEHRFELAPSALLALHISREGPNTPGWALVVVDETEGSTHWGMRDGFEIYRGERLMATAFYTVTGPRGQLLSRVGVVPAVYERAHFQNSNLVAQFGNGVNTGVAFVNTSPDPITVEVSLRNAEGELIASRMVAMGAGQQMALFVDELFPGAVPQGFQGTLQIRTLAEGVVSMGLLMTEGILTSIPTHHFGQWQRQSGMMP